MPTPTVDQEKCIGCGLCAAICPEVFEMRDDGKAYVKDASACNKPTCKEAAESCPVQAIILK